MARRRRSRRRILTVLCILFFLVCGGIVYELNQSAVRISNVQVYGADQSLASFATRAMQGKYLWLIPRDSTFLYPASRIRTDIVNAHPDIAAISLFRNGLTGLSIKVNDRVAIARWCGLAPTAGVDEYCYVFDAGGFIFAANATSTQPINTFKLYTPLVGDTLEPLRATLAETDKLPAVFDFARKLDTLGGSVTKIILRDDEVDDILASGTRITYVLGNEENAFTALVSARENMNLTDGSVDYVDLRFGSKVYLKKK